MISDCEVRNENCPFELNCTFTIKNQLQVTLIFSVDPLPTFGTDCVNDYRSCFRGFTSSSVSNFKEVGVVFVELLPDLR